MAKEAVTRERLIWLLEMSIKGWEKLDVSKNSTPAGCWFCSELPALPKCRYLCAGCPVKIRYGRCATSKRNPYTLYTRGDVEVIDRVAERRTRILAAARRWLKQLEAEGEATENR